MKIRDLRFTIGEHSFSLKYLGLFAPKFDDGGEQRDTFLIVIGKDRKQIDFRFYDSIHNTHIRHQQPNEMSGNKHLQNDYYHRKALRKLEKELVYSVLACVYSDFHFDSPDVWAFCAEFGYEPSKEAEKTYQRCREQEEKLKSIFTEEEISQFDEEDDSLKKLIENINPEVN